MVGVLGVTYYVGDNISRVASWARFFVAQMFIERYYVTEVEPETVIDGAIRGMVGALGDRNSSYLDSKSYQKLKSHQEASFGGIGIVMGFQDKKVMVINVMEGQPGEKAGLKEGDEILAVDGVDVKKYTPDEIALHVRGEVGTTVVLQIARKGEEKKDYVIERATIHVKTAVGTVLRDGMGYIRISSFAEKTGEEFAEELNRLKKEGMKGLIIDVRENPGGLLSSCVEVCKTVVPKGPIVSLIYRDGEKEEYLSELEVVPCPIVVLVDEHSASASEILAGALKDTKAAVIVGKKSFGKGSVQAVFPLGTGDAMKLTTAKYYTPNGVSIDGTGIEPDYSVDLKEEGTIDFQKEKAVEILESMIKEK